MIAKKKGKALIVKKKNAKNENCPNCGRPFDPKKDKVIECPKCGTFGSTACCNMGGKNVNCAACEEADYLDEIGE